MTILWVVGALALVWCLWRVCAYIVAEDLITIIVECTHYELARRNVGLAEVGRAVVFLLLVMIWASLTTSGRTLHGGAHLFLILAMLLLARQVTAASAPRAAGKLTAKFQSQSSQNAA